MATPMDESAPRGQVVSRKEVRRVLRQISVGTGAVLLAAVDDWNVLADRHSARLRTAMHPLGRGSYVAATTAACVDVWLNTHGMHPPKHLVVRPCGWPAVSSHGKTYLAIHHSEVQPSNPRRTAFCNQDAATFGLVGDPTLCEFTWDYGGPTASYVTRIWVSAPGVDWDPIEVPMAHVQAQLAAWRKRQVKWLPGTLAKPDAPAAGSLPPRGADQRLRPDIEVPQHPDQDNREAR